MQRHNAQYFEDGVEMKQMEKETARVQVKQRTPRVQSRREIGMMVDRGIYNLEKLKQRRDYLSKHRAVSWLRLALFNY